jgi:hypothetical protein
VAKRVNLHQVAHPSFPSVKQTNQLSEGHGTPDHFPPPLKQFATNPAPAPGLRRSLSSSDSSPHKISKFTGFRITGGKFSPVLSLTGSFGHHW